MESTSSNEYASSTNSNQSKPNKVRLAWTPELHLKFVKAVKQLGVDKAVPKSITEMMNVKGLTRRHVASHLQKYRNFLKTKDSGDGPKVVGNQMPRQSPRQTVVPGFGGGPEIPYLGLDDIMMRNFGVGSGGFGTNLDVWNNRYLVCNERRLDFDEESRSRENRPCADSADYDQNGDK